MVKNISERIDKWLWHVRLFKTRNQAAQNCRSGKVKVNGRSSGKSSSPLKAGDRVTIQYRYHTRTVQVLDFPKRRVAAKHIDVFYRDLTPPAEYRKKELVGLHQFAHRPRGMGRPSKKERRQIETLRRIKKQ